MFGKSFIRKWRNIMATSAISLCDTSIMPGQMKEFWSQVNSKNIDKYMMGCLLEGKDPFHIPEDPIERMDVFYQKFFGLRKDSFWDLNIGGDLDDIRLEIFEKKREGQWLIIIPKGLTYEMVVRVFTRLLRVQFPEDVISTICLDREARSAKDGPYSIWTGSESGFISLKDYKSNKKKIQGLTLLERMILEIYHWWLAKKEFRLDGGHESFCLGTVCKEGAYTPSLNYHHKYNRTYISLNSLSSEYGNVESRVRSVIV